MTDANNVPKLKRNLIFLGKLDKKGYVVKGDHNNLRVMKGSKEVLRSIKRRGLYILEAGVVSGSAYVASIKHMLKTGPWHKRVGYVNERGLAELSKQNLLCGDNVKKMEFCVLV